MNWFSACLTDKIILSSIVHLAFWRSYAFPRLFCRLFFFFFFLFFHSNPQERYATHNTRFFSVLKNRPQIHRQDQRPLLFSPEFHRLISESLQVFHNSNGIFGLLLSRRADINDVLHISNCTFIIRKRRECLNELVSIMTRNRDAEQSTDKRRANRKRFVNIYFRLARSSDLSRSRGEHELNVARRYEEPTAAEMRYLYDTRVVQPYRNRSNVFRLKYVCINARERARRKERERERKGASTRKVERGREAEKVAK